VKHLIRREKLWKGREIKRGCQDRRWKRRDLKNFDMLRFKD